MNHPGNESCTDIKRQLAAYSGGGLTPDQRSHVERHLAGCSLCSSEWRKWQHMETMLQHFPRPVAPRDLTQQILQRIRQEPRETAVAARVLKPAAYRGAFPSAAISAQIGPSAAALSLGLVGLLLGSVVALAVPLLNPSPLQLVARIWIELFEPFSIFAVASKWFIALAWSSVGGLVTWMVARMTPETQRMGA